MKEKIYDYPTLEKAKKSNKRQLAFWYRYLPHPGEVWINTSKYQEKKESEGLVMDHIIKILFNTI